VTSPVTSDGLRRVGGGLARYRAVALTLVAALVMVALFPSVGEPVANQLAGPSAGGGATASTIAPLGTVAPGGSAAGDVTTGPGGTVGAGGPGSAGPGSTIGPGAAAGLPANCDPATGRIKFPSVFAPPCVQSVAENGGSTYQGVTADEIKVVLYRPQPDPAVDALLRAAGASDDPAQVVATYRDWIEMFQSTYESYGRRIRLEVIQGSGKTTDDAAARADAIQVATQMKPFLVIGGPSPFVDELARRGIVVITQLQRPNQFFEARDPFVFGTQMSSTQAFTHLAEYIGKRLAGHPARHAGDPALQAKTRSFGLIYLDTAEGIYRPGVDFLEAELARYGTGLTDSISYEAEISRAQEQARVMIARLKDRGVTTVLFSGDPLAPIFLTQEATRQQFFPEWVIPGGTLVDTNFFGRTYDQRQWAHAFGISQLWIRPPNAQAEPFYQHQQYFGRPPTAPATPEVTYQEVILLATGIHMAGPNLNPATFRDGLFAYPPSGEGRVAVVARSWGRHGLWGFTDYAGWDSVTEVWWDPNVRARDELGNTAPGAFQFVDGGRRYAPGQWPTTEPAAFNPAGARTSLDQLPESDRYPTYPEFKKG
jgi:hypothetical protein